MIAACESTTLHSAWENFRNVVAADVLVSFRGTMADEQKPKGRKKEPKAEGGLLVETAKAIGVAAGKVAALAGVDETPKPRTESKKIPKLQKKNKSRLPRRQKKLLQKKAAAQSKA